MFKPSRPDGSRGRIAVAGATGRVGTALVGAWHPNLWTFCALKP